MTEPSPRPGLARRDATVVFLVALALRLILLATSAGDPVVRVPMLDAEYAVDWARGIAAGDVWGSPEHTAYFRTPLYSWFLALAFGLPGPDLGVARVLQAILGALAAVVVARMAGRRFSRTAGLVAGGLAATAWPLLLFGRELLIVTLAFLLGALSLDALDRAFSGPSIRRWIVAGLWIGLACVARANFALLVPVAAALALLGPARRLPHALAVTMAAAIVIAPIAIRNHHFSGEWIPLSWQGGINLYLGNHPGADGVSATLPGFTSWRNEDVEALLTRELGHRPGPGEQDRHFRALALEYLRDSPGDFARGLLRKTALFFQSYEIRNNRDLYWLRDRTGWLRGPWPDWGWIVPLAFVGLFVGGPARRWRPLLPTLAYAAALAASPILFFVCARYRIPAWPAFLVLAGAGGAAIVGPGVRPPRRLAALAAVIALVVVTRLDPFGIRNPDVAPVHFQYANVLARIGEDAEAEREFREALAITPGYPEARYHLGALLLRQGRVGEAFPELDAAVRAMPSSFRARRSLAEAWETAGRADQAIPLRREIVALTGGALEDRFQLATALGLAGRYEESLAEFRALDDTPLRDDSDFLLNAGQTALALGREDLGLEWLERALERPDAREFASDALARYWLSRENWDAGLRVLSNGLLRTPDSEPLLRLRAHARRATGDATGAIEDWEHVLRLAPGDSVATEELAGLREQAGP